jgi:hypothetical protein
MRGTGWGRFAWCEIRDERNTCVRYLRSGRVRSLKNSGTHSMVLHLNQDVTVWYGVCVDVGGNCSGISNFEFRGLVIRAE